jgi:hypothetical protein
MGSDRSDRSELFRQLQIADRGKGISGLGFLLSAFAISFGELPILYQISMLSNAPKTLLF